MLYEEHVGQNSTSPVLQSTPSAHGRAMLRFASKARPSEIATQGPGCQGLLKAQRRRPFGCVWAPVGFGLLSGVPRDSGSSACRCLGLRPFKFLALASLLLYGCARQYTTRHACATLSDVRTHNIALPLSVSSSGHVRLVEERISILQLGRGQDLRAVPMGLVRCLELFHSLLGARVCSLSTIPTSLFGH